MSSKERPREKAVINGIESLSNRELLAIILRCGYKGTSVLQMAEMVLNEAGGLLNLYSMNYEELIKIKGISSSKALEILSAFEISKRVSFENLTDRIQINSPKNLSQYLNQKIGFKKQENFHVLFLNTKNQIICEKTLFIGTLNVSVVHPREIFKEAIQKNAASIIVSHNHPSSNCNPSEQDIVFTKSLVTAGDIIGISVIDHIVVSHNNYFSFKEKNLID
ncbi:MULTISPECIES: DNA repair protein RadC [unclassified Breznakia]|uniref:RadC family protein n=1 Tax=unclassified Breznakia TaxID=2623764 RepID=UPI00240526C7|nr:MULTISPECIES: DNA repair protein RadC [unclassified Breznakia]